MSDRQTFQQALAQARELVAAGTDVPADVVKVLLDELDAQPPSQQRIERVVEDFAFEGGFD